MPQYVLKDDHSGYESGYESEGGTHYKIGKVLGAGVSARGRILKSTNRKKKNKVVLDPTNIKKIDYNEAQTKYCFFKTLYPDSGVELIKKPKTYRLIVPLVPGVPFKELPNTTKKLWVEIFISAISALKACHEKGYIVVDLHSENIHYDVETDQSHLIDGGLAAHKDESISTSFFCNKTKAEVNKHRKSAYSCAPECWSTAKQVIAKTSMDVYALGLMMRQLKAFKDTALEKLIQNCLNVNPDSRPTLETLEETLREYQVPPLKKPLPFY